MPGKTIVILGTLDTKGPEAGFLKEQVEHFGHRALLVDTGVVGRPALAADVGREEVARAGGAELSELLDHPKIRSLYHEIVEDLNKDLSRFETLKRFALLPEAFTQEAGELTSTNRLRRQIIERHYRREINEMYWGQE